MKEKVAVKSGYYFEIFDKENLPNTLKKTSIKVKLNDITYNLYEGTSLEDEKHIDDMFGDKMGYSIDEHTIEKPKCALIGEDGNIFYLMGIASRTLKRNGMHDEAKEMCDKITTSKSYDQALSIISDYVEITSREEMQEEEFEDEEYE